MQWRSLFPWTRQEPAPISVVPKRERSTLAVALYKARKPASPKYPIQAPTIAPGVLPQDYGAAPVVMAMDSGGTCDTLLQSSFAFGHGDLTGFPGYPYLSMLSTRAEYRAMAATLATELTREWITINSTDTEDDSTKDKITALTKAIKDMGLQQIIQRAAEHDAYFGRAQIFIDIKGQARDIPLVISEKTIKKGAKFTVHTVEAIWTTPAVYSAMDPTADDFYKPSKWFMLGQEVHASRLLTIITRPLPDMLKPAFNFGGMSLSQLAEPYVNNWLRTRQSVSDLVSNFSIIALMTKMDALLQGGLDSDPASNGTDLVNRAELFNAMRDNRGLMMLDKDSEELAQIAVPLGGLHELQAQSLEQLCVVSRQPSVILTGIEPSGLNASSDSSIRVHYDWISAQQESYYHAPVDTIFNLLQLSMYGAIDPDITWSFVSLYQMTPKELSEIRLADSTAAVNYINAGSIDAEEDRERLARDPESGYEGLNLAKKIIPPAQLMAETESDNEGGDEKK